MTLPILQAVSRINSNNYFYDKTFTLNYISKYLNFIVHNIRMKSHTYRILLDPDPVHINHFEGESIPDESRTLDTP